MTTQFTLLSIFKLNFSSNEKPGSHYPTYIICSILEYTFQYSCLENPMDRGAWWAAVHGVAMSRIQLSDFSFTFHFHALEEEMATHSSILAWRIPGTGQPDGLPSVGLHRVGHDWSDLAAAEAAAKYTKAVLELLNHTAVENKRN